MSIFSDLPPVGTTLDTDHEDAVNLVHAWLFNAGSGTVVHEYVGGGDATINAGKGSWASGGGYTFNEALARALQGPLSNISAPYTIVAGVRWDATTGYQSILGNVGGSMLVGSNGTSMYVYTVTADKWYLDGSEYASAQTIDTTADHVVGYHIHSGNLVMAGSYPAILGNDGWDDEFKGKIAFVYIYSGETDSALQARLAASPYDMFSAGSSSASTSASTSSSTSESASPSVSPSTSSSASFSGSSSPSASESASPSLSASSSPSVSASTSLSLSPSLSASSSPSASESASPSSSESTSPSPTGSVSPSASSSTSASRSASVSPSTSPSLSPSASVSGSSSSSTSASVSASASPSPADIDQYVFDGNPQIMLQYSDDGGHTWSEELWVSAGVEGAYRWRAMWRRLGKSRDRVWRVDMSDPVPWRILSAIVNVGKGTS